MDYTQSPQFVNHAGTGQNMHEENQATTTVWSEKDANSLIWSLMELVKAGGQAGQQFNEAVPATYKVLLKAMKAAFGGNVTIVNAANSPYVLTLNNSGLVYLDATAGDVDVTLPAANALTAVPLGFRFVRWDATANTATVNRAGADTFVGGGTSFTLSGQGDCRVIHGDATSKWATISVVVTTGHGQCQLSKSGANLILLPKNGNRLMVNGVSCSIPAAGVTLAPPETTNTTCYIYAVAAGGVVTSLEASVTGHSADAAAGNNQGVEIKTGDATRTLVGMARTVGSAWVDTTAKRFVRSWFNDQGVGGEAFMSAASASTASPDFIELATDMRNEFLLWLGEKVTAASTGECVQTTYSSATYATLAYDGIVPEDIIAVTQQPVANFNIPLTVVHTKSGLAEGYHYATLVVRVSSGSATWYGGATSAQRMTLNTRVGT